MKLRQAAIRSMGAVIFASCYALALPVATAADPAPTNNAKFNSLDVNRDGALSRSEVRGMRDYDKAFDEADENRDGRLSPGEFLKAESIHDRARTAAYAEDSVTTAKVKAALLKASELKSLDVSVETYKGQVLLSGFVKSEKQRDRAIQVASAVEGVAGVKDGLVVR